MIKESKILFSDVLSCPEAAKMWGFSEDKVKRYCREGKFLPTEARQTGKYWILTRQGMGRVFGPRPE
ncbi:MAG: helix-turn-helix domain-containing protein [Desulfosporosinus sp.]